MRTYLIDSEKNEHLVELSNIERLSEREVKVNFTEDGEEKSFFYRRLGERLFISSDQKAWRAICSQGFQEKLLERSDVYNIYRGFKPSGLSSGAQGELLTQMPGKVVKLMVEENTEVTEGQTVMILEAMKMENEIKAPMDGVVKAVHVKEGEALETGVLMMEIE